VTSKDQGTYCGRLPDVKTVKNRLHLDLAVAANTPRLPNSRSMPSSGKDRWTPTQLIRRIK
jgi:hypothetical protein